MILGWINKLDTAALTSTPATVSGLPLANAQVDPLGLPARVTGAAFTIDFDFGSSTPWRVFAALPAGQGFDLSSAATVRVTLSDVSSAGVELYDSGNVAAGIIAGYAQVYHVLPAAVSARYGRIALADAGAATIDVGRLAGYGGAGLWEPSLGHDLGRSIVWQRAGTRDRTKGGQIVAATDARWRVMNFTVSDHPSAEMAANALEIGRAAGLDGSVLVMLDPAGSPQYESVYGLVLRPGRMIRRLKTMDTMAFEIEERL